MEAKGGTAMSSSNTPGTSPGRVVPLRFCGFPECEEDAVTNTGMCESHRRVSVSGTGSWLEAG
jgi:hypothetical protein